MAARSRPDESVMVEEAQKVVDRELEGARQAVDHTADVIGMRKWRSERGAEVPLIEKCAQCHARSQRHR